MSTFNCPACKADLPDFQQAAGFCPYCDAKWEVPSGRAPVPDVAGTLDSSHPEWNDDIPSSGQPNEEASTSGTLQLGNHADEQPGSIQRTIDLPAAGLDLGNGSDDGPDAEANQTLGFGGEDTDIGHTITLDDAAPVEDHGQTVSLGGGQEDAGRTIDLPSSGDDGMQTLDLKDGDPTDRRTTQTLDFHDSNGPQNTLDIDSSSPADFITLGSKPLSPSGVKKFWGHLGEGSPMQTMRSATVSRAKELGVDLRRRVLSDQEEGSDYAIINQIGKGGMGVVYAAKQKSLRRRVAVKTLKRDIGQKEDDRAKFLSEAVITGVLDHPNIVPIHELGQTEDGTLFYSMKCVTGTEWHKVVRNKSEAENLEILMKVADAVAFAHSKNVIHRDLKPENVMLGEYGEVLVMDWGLAVDLNRKEEFTMGGTPAYMSPEMAKGPLDRIGKCSDIYLLGAILYEIVTGFPPHAASTITECLVAAAQNVIVRSESNSRLKSIALKAMATSPKLRFNSVALFQEEIRKYQSTAQSIELAHTSQKELEAAKDSGSYELFSRAMFGFEDALKLWNENDTAEKGVREARLEYAKCALAKGDYDLGLQLVSPTSPDEEPIFQQLTKAKRAAERNARNVRRARIVAVASLLVMLIGAGIGMALIDAERGRAVVAEDRANEEAENARLAEQDATKQKELAIIARDEAKELATDLAAKTTDLEKANTELTQNTMLIAKQNDELGKALEDARQQRKEALTQENLARFAGIFSAVGLAQSKIEANNISSSLSLLASVPEEYRGWEWKHLAYLCHPNVPSADMGTLATAVAVSPSGERTAIGTEGKGVYVYNGQNASADKQPQHLDLPPCRVTALRFSPDGKQLWIGTNHAQQYLLVWDFEKAPIEIKDKDLEGKSPASIVRAIEFGPDRANVAFVIASGYLLRVSTDTLAAKSDLFALDMFDVAVSPDGTEYVHTQEYVSEFNITRRKMTSSDEIIAELQLEDRAEWCEYLPDGRILFTMVDGTLRVWHPDRHQEEIIATLPSQINQLRFDSSRNQVALALADGSLKLFTINQSTGELRESKTLRGHEEAILDCAYHPTREEIVSVSEDQTARFWNYKEYVDRREAEHEGPVLWAGFSEDGEQFVTGGEVGTAQTWSSRPGSDSPQTQFQMGHWNRQNTSDLALSVPLANGKYIVTADPSMGIDVWDVAAKRIVGHRDTFAGSRRVAAIPGTERFVYVDAEPQPQGNPRTILRFANAQAQVGYSLPYSVSPELVLSLAVSPSGHRFAILSPVGIEVIELPPEGSSQPTVVWKRDVSGVQQIGFIADNILAIGNRPGSRDGFVSLVNLAEDKVLHRFPSVDKELPFLLFNVSPDNSHIAIVYHNIGSNVDNKTSQVCLFEAESGKQVGSVSCSGRVTFPSISSDNSTVYFVQADGEGARVGKWIVGEPASTTFQIARPGRKGSETERHIARVDAFPAEKNVIQVSYYNRDVELWNAADGTCTGRLSPARPVIFSAYTDDDRKTVTVHQDGLIRLWDAESGQHLQQWDVGYQLLKGASLNGSLLAAGGDSGEVAIVDLSKTNAPRIFPSGDLQVDSVVWLTEGADGKLLVATSGLPQGEEGPQNQVGQLRLIDSQTGQKIGESFAAHSGTYRALATAKNGQQIAAGSSNKQVRLWIDVPIEKLAQENPHELRGHSAEVSALAFSQDGQRMVSGSADGSLTIWFVDRHQLTGQKGETTKGDLIVQEFIPLKGHRKEVTSITFSSDNKKLLTSSTDRRTILWYSTELPGGVHPEQGGIVQMPAPALTR